MCRGRRARLLLHLHIQLEGTVLRGSRAGRRYFDMFFLCANRNGAPRKKISGNPGVSSIFTLKSCCKLEKSKRTMHKDEGLRHRESALKASANVVKDAIRLVCIWVLAACTARPRSHAPGHTHTTKHTCSLSFSVAHLLGARRSSRPYVVFQ